MGSLDIYLLFVVLATGSFVQCKITKTVEETWEFTRNECQLLNSSFLCDNGPDPCDPKNDLEVPTGRFWIGAYVHATTIIMYKGCKPVPLGANPVFTSVNITLRDCVEKCQTEYQHDNSLIKLGLHMDSCFCATRDRQLPEESDCDRTCTSDPNFTCGGQTSMSTYEFTRVGGTQKSGPLSFLPVCGIWNNKFKNCTDLRKAVCQNGQTSLNTMPWPEANKWCQEEESQLTTDRTLQDNNEHWINLIKHRFVSWVDGAVPETASYCVSLMCESGACSFFSDSCTRKLPGLCLKTSDDDSVNMDSKSTRSPPSQSTSGVPLGLIPTPTRDDNSSYIPILNAPHTEKDSGDGMLVYILIAAAVIVIVILVIILTFVYCRKRKWKQTRSRSKPDSSNMEEPAVPLMEKSVDEQRASDDYDRVKEDYGRIKEDFEIDTKTTGNGDYDKIKGDYDNNSGDDDPAYARVTSFATSEHPEVDEVLKRERDSDNYDLLPSSKRPEGRVDSTYDHIPAETDEDNYNVFQSQDNLHKDEIGDFMYDVTSAINGLGNYDTFRNDRNVNADGDYDTAESVLRSDS